MVFVSQTFTIEGVSYIITDEAKAAELALRQLEIETLETQNEKMDLLIAKLERVAVSSPSR